MLRAAAGNEQHHRALGGLRRGIFLGGLSNGSGAMTGTGMRAERGGVGPSFCRLGLPEHGRHAGLAVDIGLGEHSARKRQRDAYRMIHQHIHIQSALDRQRFAAVEPGGEAARGKGVIGGRGRPNDLIGMRGVLQFEIFVVGDEQSLRFLHAERFGDLLGTGLCVRRRFEGLEWILRRRIVGNNDCIGRNDDRRRRRFIGRCAARNEHQQCDHGGCRWHCRCGWLERRSAERPEPARAPAAR